MHLSVDDVILVFRELTERRPHSIFDCPFFHFFLDLHNRYGLVLSCYCFYQYGDFILE